MCVYKFEIVIFDGDDERHSGYVFGETFTDAMDRITDIFSEGKICEVKLEFEDIDVNPSVIFIDPDNKNPYFL